MKKRGFCSNAMGIERVTPAGKKGYGTAYCQYSLQYRQYFLHMCRLIDYKSCREFTISYNCRLMLAKVLVINFSLRILARRLPCPTDFAMVSSSGLSPIRLEG